MLYDIVRKMPDGSQVQAELVTGDSGRLSVSAGNIRFELACLPQDDFPQMSPGTLPHRFRLGASDLIALIERTRFAISTEETRFYLNGIYLHAAKDGKQESLRAVATDGHRLARYELDLPEGAKDIPGRDRAAQDCGGVKACLPGRRRRRHRDRVPTPRVQFTSAA
jgi:DNA polymerase-3 subunit beta